MQTLFQPGARGERGSQPGQQCFHCGNPCDTTILRKDEKAFCCQGCLTVFEILNESGLTDFYKLSENAGVRVKASGKEQFAFLDEPAVRERIVDFSNAKLTRVSFHIPAIHCIACVWLLENLFRLKPGIGQSHVNFPQKEIAVSFENEKVKLSELVGLLASLGYEPDLKFSDLEKTKAPVSRRLWLQFGIAGFAFGNIMLFSISSYLGLDVEHFKTLFGYLSFALALPVVVYSAADYLKSSWLSLRCKLLTIEVPIAAGIVTIFVQSTYEVFSGCGEGYFDSLCGLLFFLLCGKLFQQKTYDRLAFDRDYKSFFPLSVTRIGETSESISLSQLKVGDRLLIRNGELIPADSRLIVGSAVIDYSFVTGESSPVAKRVGDYLYAGGRQIGAAIEVETMKVVSQSYLTSLWNEEAFKKEKGETLDTLTNVYSYRFTKLILGIAVAAALFWWFTDANVAVKAFTSVLIVACPCALALVAPFTLGTAQRVLARRNIFLKNPGVIETLAKIDAVVFDKTGTLTTAGGSISFVGEPLTQEEKHSLAALTRNSTHPLSAQIAEALGESTTTVRSFRETTACGIEGLVAGKEILAGSLEWLESKGIASRRSEAAQHSGSCVHIAVNGNYRGCFILTSAVRPQTESMIRSLGKTCDLALLSGDNERERETFAGIFGKGTNLEFNQNPKRKFEFVAQLHRRGKTVMMVGDGLNDAGALKNADVGVAVVESISAFSPASDVIMSASMVTRLDEVLAFSKAAVRIVRLSFLISSVYNIVGISIAASGKLAPVVCAILMPLSSVTVVAFACGMTTWAGKRIFGPTSAAPEKANLHTPAITQLQEAA